MKLSTESLTKNECKEDSLTVIVKEVPNFLNEDISKENICWLQGSHQDILVGRQNLTGCPTRQIEESTPNKANEETTEQPQESQLLTEKLESAATSKSNTDTSPVIKKFKKRSSHNPLKIEVVLDPRVLKNFKTEPSVGLCISEEFGEECSWLVKLINDQSLNSSVSEDDEKFVTKWQELESKNLENYENNQVLKLLDEAQKAILESCIILTTKKLCKAIKKDESNNVICDANMETLLDETMEEEEINEKTSKISLALGRFVTKYLKFK